MTRFFLITLLALFYPVTAWPETPSRAPAEPAMSTQPASAPADGAEASSAETTAGEAPAAPSPAALPDDSAYEITVVGHPPLPSPTPGRASSTVSRRQLQERLPRSAPDALRYEPGVYVQKTAHAQGSAYIRGRTGQQTLLLFDGIRLNNSTFRQGPNQYFFTIDAHVIDHIEVTRGSASTLYGSDALGGVINALPMGPRLLSGETPRLELTPSFRYASSDRELGGRLQVELQPHPDVALLAGAGYRDVGLLRSGGPITSPGTGEPPLVPRYADDGVTQRGTSFSELAADGRVLWRLSERLRLTAAYYDYRQLDAPRTDLCPPPYAPISECLRYEEQFRSLAYLALDGARLPLAETARVALSYQRQHERRHYDRPASFTTNGGRDDVHTAGVVAQFVAPPIALGRPLSLEVRYGGDLYHDEVRSAAWTTFSDIGVVVPASRGQYLDGSRYTWGGVYLQGTLDLVDRVALRCGGRLSGIGASAPADPESGTAGVDRSWLTVVGHAGVEVAVVDALSLLASVDRSFRAPNLDDLTSRQQTGPGFQFENDALAPETVVTLEAGARLDLDRFQASGWVYRAAIDDAIERAPRDASACPPQTPQCGASWSRFQLVNLSDSAVIYGAEAVVRTFLPWGLSTRATIAFSQGSGPNPAREADPAATPERVPLSRIPPLNGTFELRWRHSSGVYAGAGLRWALTQHRLSLGDQSDERIPAGGTPGFAVVDLRGGYRLGRHLVAGIVVENLLDTPYRYHGSSVDGPGLGVVLSLEGRRDLW